MKRFYEKLVSKLNVMVGNTVSINSQSIKVLEKDSDGKVLRCTGTVTITDGGAGYAKGCEYIKTDGAAGSIVFINEGTTSSCDFNATRTSLSTISPASLAASEALTSTADGTGTGAMSGNASHAIVTSAGAANQISLPASSAALLGKQFTIWVGANGFELITPAASNATINNIDSDGTNQADIGANTLSRLTLVTTNTWILENLSNLGAVNTAIIPDND